MVDRSTCNNGLLKIRVAPKRNSCNSCSVLTGGRGSRQGRNSTDRSSRYHRKYVVRWNRPGIHAICGRGCGAIVQNIEATRHKDCSLHIQYQRVYHQKHEKDQVRLSLEIHVIFKTIVRLDVFYHFFFFLICFLYV